MVSKSKRKGDTFEREIVDALNNAGLDAQRVPLSGAAEGHFSGDVIYHVKGEKRTLECKRRASGFKTLYGWLAGNQALVVRDDRTEPLVILRFADWLEMQREP